MSGKKPSYTNLNPNAPGYANNRNDPDFWQGQRWQVFLAGQWKDFSPEEDGQLKSAFSSGRNIANLTARKQKYRVDFEQMTQKNVSTEPYKERKIRHPCVSGP